LRRNTIENHGNRLETVRSRVASTELCGVQSDDKIAWAVPFAASTESNVVKCPPAGETFVKLNICCVTFGDFMVTIVKDMRIGTNTQNERKSEKKGAKYLGEHWRD